MPADSSMTGEPDISARSPHKQNAIGRRFDGTQPAEGLEVARLASVRRRGDEQHEPGAPGEPGDRGVAVAAGRCMMRLVNDEQIPPRLERVHPDRGLLQKISRRHGDLRHLPYIGADRQSVAPRADRGGIDRHGPEAEALAQLVAPLIAQTGRARDQHARSRVAQPDRRHCKSGLHRLAETHRIAEQHARGNAFVERTRHRQLPRGHAQSRGVTRQSRWDASPHHVVRDVADQRCRSRGAPSIGTRL